MPSNNTQSFLNASKDPIQQMWLPGGGDFLQIWTNQWCSKSSGWIYRQRNKTSVSSCIKPFLCCSVMIFTFFPPHCCLCDTLLLPPSPLSRQALLLCSGSGRGNQALGCGWHFSPVLCMFHSATAQCILYHRSVLLFNSNVVIFSDIKSSHSFVQQLTLFYYSMLRLVHCTSYESTQQWSSVGLSYPICL